MKQTEQRVDIGIIGAGAGGLSVAAGAVQMGASVALAEAGKMGGDCLNYGCVPSKSLLAAAHAANTFRRAELFGIQSLEPNINFQKVMQHVHGVIAKISVHDSIERFTKLGVHVISAPAKFIDENTVQAGDQLIRARRFVIATGSSPAIPVIPGLENIKYYTNENIFELQEKPQHLIVIGGGPIGCELATAFHALGSQVTILEAYTLLTKDDPELVNILHEHFIQQGITIHENCKILQVEQAGPQIKFTIEKNQQKTTVTGTAVLIAAGRQPNIAQLNLAAASIAYSAKAITVNSQLQTTNKRVYAIGDVTGHYQFTHVAGYHAGIVIRNILFRMRAKVDYRAIPWVTYTQPELAHVGMRCEDVCRDNSSNRVLTWDFNDNDRAQAEHDSLGKIKVCVDKKGKILGASILGPHAGELLLPWIMAIQEGKNIKVMTNVIAAYPTLSEVSKRVAGEFYKPLIFSKRMRLIVKLLSYFG